MICSADMCFIYVINVSVCANYFFGFYMWGRVPGWQLFSGVGVLKCGDTPVQRN